MIVVAVGLAGASVGALNAVEDSDKERAERGERAQDEDEPAFSVGPDDKVADDVCRVNWSVHWWWMGMGMAGETYSFCRLGRTQI